MTNLLRAEAPSNVYRNRWRWWYSAIADLMIAHPDWKMTDIAKELKKGVNTISMIANTDLFRAHLAQRKQQWQEIHDQALREKLTKVANASLDALVTSIEKKKDLVPIQALQSISEGALDRLGFSPKPGPQVLVQNNIQNNNVLPSASLGALEEARAAMRQVEQLRASQPMKTLPPNREIDLLLEENGLSSSADDDLIIGDGADVSIPSE